MSDVQEFHATTVEEALKKASSALNVAPDRLRFEVLDAGSTGFLGIGARDARIVIRTEQRTDKPAQPKGNEQMPEPPGGEGMARIDGEEKWQPLEDPSATVADAPYEVIVAVDEFMTTLLGAMGLDATVDAHDTGDAITVEVSTKETGLFIGQKGETIDAVQYLLNLAVYRDRPFVKRIVIDSEGYRKRRVEAIQGMAHRAARRVLREKRPFKLPPMSAGERRIVHL
ncbi:MAG: Jag N-terminal domain-containing protein, partial [Actinomycetota bacterium]|nr:Jag N-terminal domain-containing protein [Actinomycetota bacterium]